TERLLAQAGKHGHRDHERTPETRAHRLFGGRCARASHHVQAARRVDVDHPHAKPRRSADGASDGVRDIVEFQIEEDAVALCDQFFDEPGTVAGEESGSNLESTDGAPQQIGETARLLEGIDIQRNEQLFHYAGCPWWVPARI